MLSSKYIVHTQSISAGNADGTLAKRQKSQSNMFSTSVNRLLWLVSKVIFQHQQETNLKVSRPRVCSWVFLMNFPDTVIYTFHSIYDKRYLYTLAKFWINFQQSVKSHLDDRSLPPIFKNKGVLYCAHFLPTLNFILLKELTRMLRFTCGTGIMLNMYHQYDVVVTLIDRIDGAFF